MTDAPPERPAAPPATDDAAVEPLTTDVLTARHGFFTRLGGVSEGIYAGLQCGFGASEDDPVHVARNRAMAAEAVGVSADHLITCHQIHSANAAVVAAPWTPDAAPRIDGMATNVPGLALGVLAADCAPVLFEDATAGVVGACHAGWRGALDGILEATLEAMTTLGAQRKRIRAAIGPCIGPSAYEVGPEYVARFCEERAENQRFFGRSERPGHAMFDLPAYVIARLAQDGLADAQWIGRCTYSEPDRFYSHRRSVHAGEADYGRLLSVIVPPAN